MVVKNQPPGIAALSPFHRLFTSSIVHVAIARSLGPAGLIAGVFLQLMSNCTTMTVTLSLALMAGSLHTLHNSMAISDGFHPSDRHLSTKYVT